MSTFVPLGILLYNKSRRTTIKGATSIRGRSGPHSPPDCVHKGPSCHASPPSPLRATGMGFPRKNGEPHKSIGRLLLDVTSIIRRKAMSQMASRPCPTCGTQAPAGQRFCSNCGTDLSRVEAASQYGGPPPPPPYFPQGQQVPPYTQSPCGQQQPPQFQYQPQYQQPQQQNTNPIAEALGALGLLFF